MEKGGTDMTRLNSGRALILLFPAFLLALGIILVAEGCIHPGPNFPIQNQFDQPVTIYFDGVKVGKLEPNATKTFYPNEVLTTSNTDLLLEAKSNSGFLLYSKYFTWAELTKVIESLHGTTSYKIGPGSE
jgi:hypothetical protein